MLFSWIGSLARGKMPSWKKKPCNLSGQVIIITGSNRGIGLEVAKDLLEWGAHVTFAVRDVEAGENAVSQLSPAQQSRASVEHLDLSDFGTIRAFAKGFLKREQQVNVLINNAHRSGLKHCTTTADGIEMSYQTNHLGHFLLTLLLMPCLFGGRVVNVTSRGYEFGTVDRKKYSAEAKGLIGYNSSTIYPDTKLMQILFSRELHQRHGECVETVAVHPGGLINTKPPRGDAFSLMFRLEPLLMALLGTPLAQGSLAIVKLASATNLKEEGGLGGYYCTTEKSRLLPHACDEEAATWLWETSMELTRAPDYSAGPPDEQCIEQE
jgi:NAD(P)-dependent dehydrogenase (short-subunit alcohol dehydrogenase family)